MKVLHVAKKYPDALGGDAIVVSNLEAQQVKAGHVISILTSNCDEIKNKKHLHKFGFKDSSSGLDKITPKRLFSLILLFLKSFKVLKAERPDIIHTHAVDMAFFVSFAARFYNIPIVHTFHIVTFYDKKQMAFRRMTEIMLVRSAKPRIITAPNTYDVNKLIETGLVNTVLLPNGVDMAFWVKDSNIHKNRTFTFISVGRLEKQKGIYYLLQAASRLKNQTTNKFQIIIVGSGSQDSFLKETVNNAGLNEIVRFEGNLNHTQIRKLYSQCNAAVISALWETTPLTLLEAWAMQLPCISTNVGLLRGSENLKSNAIVVPPGQINELCKAMMTLLNDQQIGKSISDAAYSKVKIYDWKNIFNITDSIYLEAIS